jgi:hypothetical protein
LSTEGIASETEARPRRAGFTQSSLELGLFLP